MLKQTIMNDFTQAVEIDPVNTQKETSKEFDKSKRQSLPIFTISDMVSFCAKIYTELGFGDYHSKDLIAKIHGVVYESIKQKFSTAQAYGLLELKHGVGYKLTDGFLKIYKPVSDAEKFDGIVDSLRLPEFYSRLLEELNGHPLPTEQGLSARLLRTFGIKEYAASKAANIFLQNLRENGIVGLDNIVRLNSHQTNPAVNANGNKTSVTPVAPQPVVALTQTGYIEIPVPLNGGKRAYIKIPEDYKAEDCERISKFVEALK